MDGLSAESALPRCRRRPGAQGTVVVGRPGIGGAAPGGELGAARVPRDSDGTPRPALPATPAEPIGRTATT
ncbi:hypothetical protein ACIBL5_32225 [Streptomyces sp. NPDC050516]|uniref:hypothetical protein n=1 Tax=Streptomyces sp. NPDC050516 TaxID=3365621 RepID=UPI00379A3EC5